MWEGRENFNNFEGRPRMFNNPNLHINRIFYICCVDKMPERRDVFTIVLNTTE